MCRIVTNSSPKMKIQILVPQSKKSATNLYPSVVINEKAYMTHSGTNLSMFYTLRDINDYLPKI